MTPTPKFQDMIGKVRSLLNKADDPASTPAEAEMLRDKAEALIFRYKLDMAQAPEEQRKASDFMPAWRTFDLCLTSSQFSAYYGALFRELVRHIDGRFAIERERREFGDVAVGNYRVETWNIAHVVGYDSDLEFVALLWESTRLAFGKRIEPRVDPKLPEATNAFNLRMGGMERHRIATAMFPNADVSTTNKQKALNRKVTKLIRQGAEAAGEDADKVLGRGNNIKTYRDSYVSGFYSTLQGRLSRMALSRGESGGAMVLASLKVRVDEAFYARYPELRPSTKVSAAASGRAEYIPANEKCERCKKTKSGYCREHMYLKPSRARARQRAWNYDAYDAGSAAAHTVDLGRGGTPKAEGGATRKEL